MTAALPLVLPTVAPIREQVTGSMAGAPGSPFTLLLRGQTVLLRGQQVTLGAKK